MAAASAVKVARSRMSWCNLSIYWASIACHFLVFTTERNFAFCHKEVIVSCRVHCYRNDCFPSRHLVITTIKEHDIQLLYTTACVRVINYLFIYIYKDKKSLVLGTSTAEWTSSRRCCFCTVTRVTEYDGPRIRCHARLLICPRLYIISHYATRRKQNIHTYWKISSIIFVSKVSKIK